MVNQTQFSKKWALQFIRDELFGSLCGYLFVGAVPLGFTYQKVISL